MRFLPPHAFLALHVPPAEHSITVSTARQAPPGPPAYRRAPTGMPRKGSRPLPALHTPPEQPPAVSAAAARGQPRPIGAPGHACDEPMMPHQPQELRPIRCVPHIHVAINASADQPRAIVTPIHATARGLVRSPDPTVAVRGHIP